MDEDEPIGTFYADEDDPGIGLIRRCQSLGCDEEATHQRLAGQWGRVTAYAYYCTEHSVEDDEELS